MKLHYLFIILTLALAGCHGHKNVSENEKQPRVKLPDDNVNADRLFLSFERTVCFGACPTFKMTIKQSGQAHYSGEANVKFIGEYEAVVSDSLMRDIINNAEAIPFFNLNEIYNDPAVTDLPSTIVYLNYDGQEKYVTARFNVPENLQGFILYLQKISDSIDWKAVDDE